MPKSDRLEVLNIDYVTQCFGIENLHHYTHVFSVSENMAHGENNAILLHRINNLLAVF